MTALEEPRQVQRRRSDVKVSVLTRRSLELLRRFGYWTCNCFDDCGVVFYAGDVVVFKDRYGSPKYCLEHGRRIGLV